MLSRPEITQYMHAMQVLGYINKSAANLLSGEYIKIKGIGQKVRKLIDEHIAVLSIEQTIAPITDTSFESKEVLHVSDETQTLLMEHLASYYICEYYEEDLIYYEH